MERLTRTRDKAKAEARSRLEILRAEIAPP
jgi:hypothetical protein